MGVSRIHINIFDVRAIFQVLRNVVIVLIYSAHKFDVNRHSCSTLPGMTFGCNVLFLSFCILQSGCGLTLNFTEMSSINFMLFCGLVWKKEIVVAIKSSAQK